MNAPADSSQLARSLATPALLGGDRVAVARAISRVERGEIDPARCAADLAPHLGRAHVVGITGAPGAGKSTLLNALLGEWVRRGRRVGVVAVDPSSPITGGAVLGDRVRMGEHGVHEQVFIRSIASRGHLGGLTPGTTAMVDILDAAGFDVVIVETVGAGQSEVEIMRLADTRLVACPPGLGDGIQAIKAGILEIADLLVVTKCDLPGADATARDLRDMLHLRAAGAAGDWTVPVQPCCAPDSRGLAELVDGIEAHSRHAGHGRRLASRTPRTAATQAPPSTGMSGTNGTPEDVATRVQRLARRDRFVCWLGAHCTEAGPGRATVELLLTDEHINFNGTCHGGVIFSLADTAFGLASNSHGVVAAGIDAHITFQQAVRAGDRLVARATEASRSRKLAVYRVEVTRAGDGAAISSFTGTVYVTSLPHTPPAGGDQDTM